MQTKEAAHLFVISICCCKEGLASLTATEMTSVSPLPPITSQQGLLQAVLNVTEKLRESSTRDLSLPTSTSMHGLHLLERPLPCSAVTWRGAEGAEPKGRAACPSVQFCLSTSSSGADHHAPGNEKGHPEERLIRLSTTDFSPVTFNGLTKDIMPLHNPG